MKTKQDNDVTDCTDVTYLKNEIELSWLIGPSDACDENEIGWLDQLYKCKK